MYEYLMYNLNSYCFLTSLELKNPSDEIPRVLLGLFMGCGELGLDLKIYDDAVLLTMFRQRVNRTPVCTTATCCYRE